MYEGSALTLNFTIKIRPYGPLSSGTMHQVQMFDLFGRGF
jgi:hypothetical protein